MIRKVLDVISVLAFVISLSLGAGSFFAYRWATNPKTHEALKQRILSELPIPGVGGLTGPGLPIPSPGKKALPSVKGFSPIHHKYIWSDPSEIDELHQHEEVIQEETVDA